MHSAFLGPSPAGSGRRGDQKFDAANQALMNAIKTGHSVPLFNKLAVNRWQLVGFFTIVDANYVHDERRSRMIWRFTLQRSQELEGHS